MAEKQSREASPPSTGAARGFVRVLLMALVAALLAGPLHFLGIASPEVIASAVGLLMLIVVMPALEAWGKFLRERGFNAPFVFLLAVLLSGCASESAKWNLAVADAEAERMSGPNITIVETESEKTTTCTGGCVLRLALSRGLSIPFTGVLGRLVEGAASFVGADLPGAPQPIEMSIEGVRVEAE